MDGRPWLRIHFAGCHHCDGGAACIARASWRPFPRFGAPDSSTAAAAALAVTSASRMTAHGIRMLSIAIRIANAVCHKH